MPDTDPAEPTPVAQPKQEEGSVVFGFILFCAIAAAGLSTFAWMLGLNKPAPPPVVQTAKPEPPKPVEHKTAVVAKVTAKPTKHPNNHKAAKASHRSYRGRVVPLPAGVASDAQAAEYFKNPDPDFELQKMAASDEGSSGGNNDDAGKTQAVRGYRTKNGTWVNSYKRHPRSR